MHRTWRTIRPFLAPYRWQIALVFARVIGATLGGLAAPWPIRDLVCVLRLAEGALLLYGRASPLQPVVAGRLRAPQRLPRWQQLQAVQNERVYAAPRSWIGSGILAANAILDDLDAAFGVAPAR